MKILVVGAAGKTGRAVVEQALAARHEVTAFVHNADGYNADGYNIAGVHVVAGDASDSTAMDAAVQGQDAVLNTIGGKTPYKVTWMVSHTVEARVPTAGKDV